MVPKSYNQSIRPAKNAQTNFSGGVFNDGIAQNVPANGLFYAQNAIPYPDGTIKGRSGVDLWADTLPTIYTGITASKSGTTITVTSGRVLDGTEQGKYFRFASDHVDYPIISVNTGAQTITTTTSAAYTAAATCLIREEVNALEWHKYTEKWVLQIGSRIYTAAYNMATWTRVYCSSLTDLSDSKSDAKIFDENAMVLFNSNGIFYINLIGNATYYKLNTSNPVSRSEDSGSGAFEFRYIVSFSRLSTISQDVGRRDSDVIVAHESGTNNIDDDYLDYTKILSATTVAPATAKSISLYPLSSASAKGEDLHWTHYSIWRTLNLGDAGINPYDNSTNSPGRFYHVDDVLIVKAMKVGRTGASELTVARGYGVPQGFDVGATIQVWGSSAAFTYTISTVTDNAIAVSETLDASIASSGAVAVIGGNKCFIGTTDGTAVITRTGGATLTSAENGKTLFSSDSLDPLTIVSVDGSGNVTVDRTLTTGMTLYLGCSPISRTFHDTVTDDLLRVRPLVKQRYWTPVDNWTVGVVSNGFIAGGIAGDHNFQYSEIGNKQWAGYHNNGVQIDSLEDQVVAISVVNDLIIVYCKENIFVYDTNGMSKQSSLTEDPEAGTQLGELPVYVFNGRKPIKGTGMYDRGTLQKDKNGNDIFETNRNETVVFNGSELSPSMTAGRIMNKITKLQRLSASAYSRTYGYLRFGTESQSL